jgi:hypothetical protein
MRFTANGKDPARPSGMMAIREARAAQAEAGPRVMPAERSDKTLKLGRLLDAAQRRTAELAAEAEKWRKMVRQQEEKLANLRRRL